MPMFLNVAARCTTSGSRATTAPPSAVVRFLVGKNENVVTSAREPTGTPPRDPPMECAASSSRATSRPATTARSPSASIGCPA